jgi:hypothetical protein
MRIARVSTVAGIAATLAACGGDVCGTWHDTGGVTSYRFGADGKATVAVLDSRVAAEYLLKGDRVLVTSPQGTVVLTRRGNRLYGPMGQELVRQN